MLALCVNSCLRCDSLARNGGADQRVRLVVAPFAFCFLEVRARSLVPNALFLKQKTFFAGKALSHGGARCDAGLFFEEASCQPRFFETKVLSLMTGLPRGNIFLSGQAATLGQSEL